VLGDGSRASPLLPRDKGFYRGSASVASVPESGSHDLCRPISVEFAQKTSSAARLFRVLQTVLAVVTIPRCILRRGHLEAYAAEMEPLLFTVVCIASHHLAIANIIAVAVQRLVCVNLAVLIVFRHAAASSVVVDGSLRQQ